MSLSKYFLPALAVIALAGVLTFVLWTLTRPAGAQYYSAFTQLTYASSTSVLTTSKQIVASTTGLRFREIVNLSGNVLYCNYNDLPATPTTGFFIPASTTKQWYGETLYSGAIRCLAVGTSAIIVNQDI